MYIVCDCRCRVLYEFYLAQCEQSRRKSRVIAIHWKWEYVVLSTFLLIMYDVKCVFLFVCLFELNTRMIPMRFVQLLVSWQKRQNNEDKSAEYLQVYDFIRTLMDKKKWKRENVSVYDEYIWMLWHNWNSCSLLTIELIWKSTRKQKLFSSVVACKPIIEYLTHSVCMCSVCQRYY